MTALPPSGRGRGALAARYLLTAATAMELAPLEKALGQGRGGAPCDFLRCGVGPVAAAATVAGYLACRAGEYAGVILTGVAGAYPGEAGLLDICLATREVLGDFGISAGHGAEPFTHPGLDAECSFPLDSALLHRAERFLKGQGLPFHCGAFVTVNAATATLERGLALSRRHQGLCENMEGAAVALACRNLRLPLLEIRCISNMVEDRDLSRWRLQEAIQRNGEILARLLPELALAAEGAG